MWWIKCHARSIPEDMKYPGWQTDRDEDGFTPERLWIEYRDDEDVPEDIIYPEW